MKKEKSIIVFAVALLFFSAYFAFGASWTEPKNAFPQDNTLIPIDVGTVGKQNRSGIINFAIPNAKAEPKIVLGINDFFGSSLDNSFISFLTNSPVFISAKPLYVLAPSVVLPSVSGNMSALIGTIAFDPDSKSLKINVDGSETGWSNVGEQGEVWERDGAVGIKYDGGNVIIGTEKDPQNIVIENGGLISKKSSIANKSTYLPVYNPILKQIPASLFSPKSTDKDYIRRFHFMFEGVPHDYNYDADKQNRLPCDNDPLVLDCLDNIEKTVDPDSKDVLYDVAYVSPEEANQNKDFGLYGTVRMKYKRYPDEYQYVSNATNDSQYIESVDVSIYPRYYCDTSKTEHECTNIGRGTLPKEIPAPPPELGWPDEVWDFFHWSVIEPNGRVKDGYKMHKMIRQRVSISSNGFPGGGIKFSPKAVTETELVSSVNNGDNYVSGLEKEIGTYNFCALGDITNYAGSKTDNTPINTAYCELYYNRGTNKWIMKYGVGWKESDVRCSANCF